MVITRGFCEEGEMARLGVRLETAAHFTPQDMQDMAALAEDRGYEVIWVPEGAIDAIAQLTAFAFVTQRAKLATGILPIFSRTPTLTAMAAGGLDAICQGRFILGLGVGHQIAVESQHGIPFRRPVTRMRETVEIVRRLLRGARVTYQGRVFSLKESVLGFSVARPHLPIYLAALGPRMIELAGEIADGVLLNWASPEYIRQAMEHLRRGATRAGRDPRDIDVACYVRTAVVEDVDLVRPRLQMRIARYFTMDYYRNYFAQMGFRDEVDTISRAVDRGEADVAAAAVSERMQSELAVVGGAEDCRRQVEELRSLGIGLPVIAPFEFGEGARESFMATIGAFSA